MSGQNVRAVVIDALRKVAGAQNRLESLQRQGEPDAAVALASLGLDSLDAVEWCMEIEARSGVELDPAELAVLASLDDLIRFVAGRLGQAADVDGTPEIVRVPRDRPLDVSFAQEVIWGYSLLPKTCAAYALGMIDRILGPLDALVLRSCLDDIVRRHEILRTSFASPDGRAVQVVHAPEPLVLPVMQLTPGADPENTVAQFVASEMASLTDLRRRPLMRFMLVRVNANEHWLLRIGHHILWDEWSTKILVGEIAGLYQAKMEGKASPFPESEALQYADYAAWQRQTLRADSPAYRDAIAWWKNFYDPPAQRADLPFRRLESRTGVDPADGIFSRPIDPELAKRVARLSEDKGATVYAVWLAAFTALLAHETGQADVVVGSYMTNRRRPQLQNMLGCFANLVALQFRCGLAQPFGAWLSEVRSRVLAAEAHSDIPQDLLFREFEATGATVPEVRAIFGAPLTQSRVDVHFSGLTLTRPDLPHIPAMPWGFSLNLHEYDGVQTCRATFDAGLYEPQAVKDFVGRLIEFVDAITRNADLPLSELLASREERPSALNRLPARI